VPAAFGFAGQSCISIQRVLAHEAIHDELTEAVAAAADDLVVGDRIDESTDVGPLIAPDEIDRVTLVARGGHHRRRAGGGRRQARERRVATDGVRRGRHRQRPVAQVRCSAR
jgi:acyl-CoA reductase-like NAD-dependent aldehyde dehydrogenase